MRHAIVNKDTGEIDPECGICGYGVSSDYSDFENFKDENHKIIEITNEEHSFLVGTISIDEGGIVTLSGRIDMGKAKQKLDDRLKVDVPIEIIGPGGPEIIGFDLKPETIVTERIKAK